MKIIFSESNSDYTNYIFSYAVWAFLEKGEQPQDAFRNGFLPSGSLTKYYLTRHVRVVLNQFALSSENKRILRKNEYLELRVVDKKDFELTSDRLSLCLDFVKNRIDQSTMTEERLKGIFARETCSHVLLFNDKTTNKEIGLVPALIIPNEVLFYAYAFYNPEYFKNSLGLAMMTMTIDTFSSKLKEIYLGTCYTQESLYKTQFKGLEFYNGCVWSDKIEELKYMLQRETQPITKHLFENKDYFDLIGVEDAAEYLKSKAKKLSQD